MELIDKLRKQINKYFVGKEEVVENVLICLLAGGHLLIEDVPGVGKTKLARTLADSIEASFGRIQFTPDTLPGDILGVSVFNMANREFEFREGAIMHQIVLADEINRTSPKTQSALLEAMAERQISVDGKSMELPALFMVIATQNPTEFLGTYPLPEAQTDRFLMKLTVGYPSGTAEVSMARKHLTGELDETVNPVCTAEDILEIRKKVKGIYVSDALLTYIRSIAELTRKNENFVTGASPRALLAIVDAAQAKAYIERRDFVKPDDVKAVAVNVLHHRLKLTGEARLRSEDIDRLLHTLILSAKVPMEVSGEKND